MERKKRTEFSLSEIEGVRGQLAAGLVDGVISNFFTGKEYLIEFTYALQIFGFTEGEFEKKCADQSSNLEDTIEVEVRISDSLEILQKKKQKNDKTIKLAEAIYIKKANMLNRGDLVQLIQKGIDKRKKITLELEAAIVKKQSAKVLETSEIIQEP